MPEAQVAIELSERDLDYQSNFTYHVIFTKDISQAISAFVLNKKCHAVCQKKLMKLKDSDKCISIGCVQEYASDAPYVFIYWNRNLTMYDPVLNRQRKCPLPINSRTDGSFVSLGDCIYAIGGHQNGRLVTEIEVMNVKEYNNSFWHKHVWKVVGDIPRCIELRHAPCVTFRNKIYIIGERKSYVSDSTTVVLVFDTAMNSVTIVAEIPVKFSNCKTVVHDFYIFIATSEGYLLRLDTNTRILHFCTDMPKKFDNFEVFTEGNRIYLVGRTKSNDSRGLLELFRYNTECDTWRKIRSFPSSSEICGCCDIKVPLAYPNCIPFS